MNKNQWFVVGSATTLQEANDLSQSYIADGYEIAFHTSPTSIRVEARAV